MTALHRNQDTSHAARRKRWACDRCSEKPLSEEIDLYFATGLCSWCSHLFAKQEDKRL
jgi:late competence protein required for DNA uptake (superfamily II DNA/RNA helicase)